MRFRTKDLMITVVPRVPPGIDPDLENLCLLGTRICAAPLSHVLITCPCNSCPRTSIPTLCTDAAVTLDAWIINDREDLAVLRTELKETLKQLDQIQRKLPSGLRTKKNAKAVTDALGSLITQIKKTPGLE